MQNTESVHERPPITVKSSGLQCTVIVIVVTALIAGAGGYLFGQRTAENPSQGNREISLQPSRIPSDKIIPLPLTPTTRLLPKPFVPKSFYPIPTTDPIKTANWKTYANEKYGVSFHYPANRYIDVYPYPATYGKIPITDDVVLHTKQTASDIYKNEENFNAIWSDINSNGQVMFFFRDETSKETFYSTPEKDLQEFYNINNNTKDEGLVIGGKMGRIVSSFSNPKSRLYNKTNNHAINIDIPLKDNKHLIIGYLGTVITLDEFSQMLSTFKFTDQQ